MSFVGDKISGIKSNLAKNGQSQGSHNFLTTDSILKQRTLKNLLKNPGNFCYLLFSRKIDML